MKPFFEEMRRLRLLPVVKIEDAAMAVPLAEALTAGGLPAAEITFRTGAAAEAISRIKEAMPDMRVLAGTVLTVEQARTAVEAGAKAIVSPGTNPEVVTWCLEREIPVVPGCATPSEVEACIRMGLDTVKLFPAEVIGGTAMLRALAGPYGGMRFMPTGGIGPQNLAAYLRQPHVLCCGGSWMVPSGALSAGDFGQIQKLTAQAVQMIKKEGLSC